jgi:hypothetical protein
MRTSLRTFPIFVHEVVPLLAETDEQIATRMASIQAGAGAANSGGLAHSLFRESAQCFFGLEYAGENPGQNIA